MFDEAPARPRMHGENSLPEDAEPPRHMMISARVSPMVELARWLFERYHIPYFEEAHAPVLHVIATRRRGGGNEVPVVVSAEGVWRGARELLQAFDAKTRPGQRLFGESEEQRRATESFLDWLLDRLLLTVRRYVYFHMLPNKATLHPVATEGARAWERGVVWYCYPLWRRLMAKGLDFAPELIAEAPTKIREAFDLVESELGRRNTTFLGGAEPDVADIVFAALAAPVVFPPGYGARLPSLAELPPELHSFVSEMRARRAGQLVFDTYRVARPPPQPPMRRRTRRRAFSEVLLSPGPQRLAARLAAAWGSPLRVGGIAFVSRWADVQQVLSRDLDFRIAPVNQARIEAVNGPFVLGLDRGERLNRERPLLYAAVAAIDLAEVRRCIVREAERLLDTAVASGRIDVSNGYARLVAARTAVHLFGINGPMEADLVRVSRAVFHHTFLNLNGEKTVAERAVRASRELTTWFEAEIARRRANGEPGHDVLGRILANGGLDDDGARRNVAGLLVGAIDTTATSVAKIVTVIGGDRSLKARVERDLGEPERMLGWCREALRRWPHNPIVLRQTAAEVAVGGKSLPAATRVAAFTQAAMFDGAVFPDPGRLDPTRPTAAYLHFGGGLHSCAGRAVNNVQLPELVARLFARGVATVGRPRFDGPFLDELVVTFRR